MRRKPGALVPLEVDICRCAAELHRGGAVEFHGYELAKTLAAHSDRTMLAAYGTLYRALGRLQDMGLLQSRWEDPRISTGEGRPGRRLYSLTGAGLAAAREARNAAAAKVARKVRRGWAPA
jgi:PadR family transcriptional regulator